MSDTLKREAMKTKVCTGCNKERPVTEFYKDRTRGDGYKNRCSGCRTATRDERLAHNRARNAALRERRKAEETARLEAAERQSRIIKDDADKKAEARRIALKKLVEAHPTEFVRYASQEYRRMNIPKKWMSLTGEVMEDVV